MEERYWRDRYDEEQRARCYFCQKKGHYVKNCPDKARLAKESISEEERQQIIENVKKSKKDKKDKHKNAVNQRFEATAKNLGLVVTSQKKKPSEESWRKAKIKAMLKKAATFRTTLQLQVSNKVKSEKDGADYQKMATQLVAGTYKFKFTARERELMAMGAPETDWQKYSDLHAQYKVGKKKWKILDPPK